MRGRAFVARQSHGIQQRFTRIMTTVKPRLKAPTYDPFFEGAAARAKMAAEEAERLGITDNKGNLLRTDLPPDMREGSARDFGG